MPPPLLIDYASKDLDQELVSRERLYAEILPHRHEFMVLDSICYHDPACKTIISRCDIHEDAWWAKGHLPGRPIMPGVIMLEVAAQTATINMALLDLEDFLSKGFMGFGGVDSCKFRESVSPPSTMHILCSAIEHRPRRFICMTQGIVNDRLVFEAKITGLVMHE